jgi:prepilin-type N-terminal cleavage/methylation domain-containing protein
MKQIKDRKIDNQGFSLVEVLVAVVILAIIVVPFLNAFMVSTKTNAKSKNILKATTIAQNILEGLKAADIEDIALEFNYPNTGFTIFDESYIPLSVGESLKNHVREYEKTITGGNIFYQPAVSSESIDGSESVKRAGTTTSIFSMDNGQNYEFLGQSDGGYSFGLEGIEVENTQYDALILADAGDYRETGSSSKKYNNQEIVNIANLDAQKDAFFIQDTNLDTTVLEDMKTLEPGHSFDEKNLSRKIQINISNVASLNGQITKVITTYTYSYLDSAVNKTYEVTNTIFDNSESGEDLRGIYLFYTPLYHSDSAASIQDEIEINNMDHLPVTVYVVKQETKDLTELENAEINYKMKLTVKEDTMIGVTDAYTDIRTNLDYNLYAAYDTTGVTEPKVEQGYYTYNTTSANQSEVKSILNIQQITGTQITDNFYDVEIRIYEKGAADLGFSDTDKILSITGSITD